MTSLPRCGLLFWPSCKSHRIVDYLRVLSRLHWLPVRRRVEYKVAC